jgi:hypothetical protein
VSGFKTNAKVKEATIEATITRKDGTVEKLGVISYYHEKWYRRLFWRLKELLHGKRFH